MPLFLSAKRISEAINRAGNSRAKGSLFDFLVVKRTLAIKKATAVAIAEREPAYIEALNQLALCGSEKAPNPYINIFALSDTKNGYRSAKFPSNGPNSTIDGNPWRKVVGLDTTKNPREASLLTGYEGEIERLALKASSSSPKPNIDDVAIWYFRSADIAEVATASLSPAQKLDALRTRFATDMGLTPAETGHLFDLSPASIDASDFVPTLADPNDYLPKVSTGLAITPASVTDSCSLDLVTALASKPFVILTGPSGTGKSRAALKMAEGIQRAVGARVNGDLFQLVKVGPDWTSPKKLLGFRTPFGETRQRPDGSETNDSYDVTETVRLILRAGHPDATGVPYFLIFDEMNLSHVERYFSTFLSLMEATNTVENENALTLIDAQDLATISELLQKENKHSPEAESAKFLVDNHQSLGLPSNVFFIGTVNVDETTYMFSPKVLDRAHVIEIEAENPGIYLRGTGVLEPGGLVDAGKATELLRGGIDDREGQRHEVPNPVAILDRLTTEAGIDAPSVEAMRNAVITALDGCYELLDPVGFPIGYRTAKEVFVYIYVWAKSRRLMGDDAATVVAGWSDALDKALLQKVLPKLHGSKRVLGDSLKATAAFLGGGNSGSNPAAQYALGLGQTVGIAPGAVLTLPNGGAIKLSKKKLEAMHGRLLATGYVSFVS